MAHWDECENCQKHERPGVVHVYGQDSEHQDVYIVGDVKALELLRDAINTALANGLGQTNVTPSDGETYTIHVVRHETNRMDALTLPYYGWERYVYTNPSYTPKGRYPSSLVPYDGDDDIMGDDEWFEAQRRLGFDYQTGKDVEEKT